MISRGAAALAVLLLFLLVVLAAPGCSRDDPAPGDATDAAEGDALPIPEEISEEEAETLLSQVNERPVLLFFPSEEGDLLVPEERIIFLTATLASQVKQAVSEVLLGPGDEEGGAVPAFPSRTRLLAVFVLRDGTAVIDLGSEAGAIPHGSAAELAAVYAIVNTVTFNFPGLERVRLLVEGQEVTTLAGHVDLSHSLVADLKRVDWGSLGAPSDPLGAAAPWERWVVEDPALLPEDTPGETLGPV